MDKDPMEIERDRERERNGEWEPDAALVPGAGSSLEDPDAAEEDDLLEGDVDDERKAEL